MEHFAGFRVALFNSATKELNAFERALKEEQARRKHRVISLRKAAECSFRAPR